VEIYLLRHGIAEDSPPGGHDADRELTAEGKRKLRAVLRRAKEAGVRPALILSSPLVRARQTAELAAEVLGVAEPVLQTRALEPNSDPHEVWEEIRIHKEEERLLMAGHEPLFSHLAAYLLDAPTLRIDFKKGALMRIDLESAGNLPRGLLRWMLTPRLSD
jgi:phosphohistidine phosphatase